MDGDRAKPNVISRSGAKIQASVEQWVAWTSSKVSITWIRRIPGGGFGRSAGLTGRSAAS